MRCEGAGGGEEAAVSGWSPINEMVFFLFSLFVSVNSAFVSSSFCELFSDSSFNQKIVVFGQW